MYEYQAVLIVLLVFYLVLLFTLSKVKTPGNHYLFLFLSELIPLATLGMFFYKNLEVTSLLAFFLGAALMLCINIPLLIFCNRRHTRKEYKEGKRFTERIMIPSHEKKQKLWTKISFLICIYASKMKEISFYPKKSWMAWTRVG